jgi:integrase/recombinase XerD
VLVAKPVLRRPRRLLARRVAGDRPHRPGVRGAQGPRRGLLLSAEGVDEILDGARRRAGLEHATCHELRHTCLTRLREAGMPPEAVQAQAGHRSLESTRVYLHLTNDWLADQYRRAAALIDADVVAVAEMLAAQEVGAR